MDMDVMRKKLCIKKMHSWLGMQIRESLYILIKIMETRSKYKRVYKKSTHVKILRDQIIQHKMRVNNLKHAKDEMKG